MLGAASSREGTPPHSAPACYPSPATPLGWAAQQQHARGTQEARAAFARIHAPRPPQAQAAKAVIADACTQFGPARSLGGCRSGPQQAHNKHVTTTHVTTSVNGLLQLWTRHQAGSGPHPVAACASRRTACAPSSQRHSRTPAPLAACKQTRAMPPPWGAPARPPADASWPDAHGPRCVSCLAAAHSSSSSSSSSSSASHHHAREGRQGGQG